MLSRTQLISVIFFTLFATSCATPLRTQSGVPEISISDFENIITDKTKKLEVYDGLYNILTVQATWLDSRVTEATLSIRREFLNGANKSTVKNVQKK